MQTSNFQNRTLSHLNYQTIPYHFPRNRRKKPHNRSFPRNCRSRTSPARAFSIPRGARCSDVEHIPRALASLSLLPIPYIPPLFSCAIYHIYLLHLHRLPARSLEWRPTASTRTALYPLSAAPTETALYTNVHCIVYMQSERERDRARTQGGRRHCSARSPGELLSHWCIPTDLTSDWRL